MKVSKPFYLILVICLMLLGYTRLSTNNTDSNADNALDLKQDSFVSINEKLVYKTFEEEKRSINTISIDDYKFLEMSKNKIDSILDFKEYMGGIEKIDDLNVVSRITDKDIAKLKRVFADDSNIYTAKNINKATLTQLKYLGFSKTEISKIVKARSKGRIGNVYELEKILGYDKKDRKPISF